jgi:hypothetical protein
MALANILRTDAHLHRMLPDDSPEARSISVLARAYQDGVWRRTKLVQELRARLREFYPGFLAAFAAGSGCGRGLSTTQLASGDARAVLAIAPSPADGLTVSKARVETALRRGGRQRRISSLAASVVAGLRVPQLRQDPRVEQAMRVETLALLGSLSSCLCKQVVDLVVGAGFLRLGWCAGARRGQAWPVGSAERCVDRGCAPAVLAGMEEPRRPSQPGLAGHKVTSNRPGKARLSAP